MAEKRNEVAFYLNQARLLAEQDRVEMAREISGSGDAMTTIGDRLGLSLCIFLTKVLVILISLSIFHSEATAQQTPDRCTDLDVVFLVDQSESMRENDRFLLRKSAVSTAIDILGDNAVYFCPGAQHRIAVLGFGSAADGRDAVKTYIPSAVISGTIDSLQAWIDQREELIKPKIPDSDNLGATDHLAALKAAARTLEEWRQNPPSLRPRRRGVILITDGGSCPRVVNNLCVWDQHYGSLYGYLAEIERLTNPNRSDFPWRGEANENSVFMWLIAFNDATNPNYDYLSDQRVWSVWQTVATGHGGQLFALSRGTEERLANAELTSVVANILNPVLGSNLMPWDCAQPIWIEPYLNDVKIIHIFRRGTDPGVALEDVKVRIVATFADGSTDELELGKSVNSRVRVGDYNKDGPNEHYVLYLPPPGRYEILVQGADKCEDLDVRLGQRQIHVDVLSPLPNAEFAEVSEPPYYDEVSPVAFEFQFFQQTAKAKQQPLVEQPGYPLTLTVSLSSVNTTVPISETYHISLVDPTRAIYSARKPGSAEPDYIRTPYPGRYEWTLQGFTTNPRRFDQENPIYDPIKVIELSGNFRVLPVEKFGFEVLKPLNGDVILLRDIQEGTPVLMPVDVTIQLVDASGRPLDPADVLVSEANDTFELRLSDPSGKLLQTLKIRPVFGDLGLVAKLRDLPPGTASDPEGNYTLDVKLLGNYKTGKFRPYMTEQRITFERTEVQSFTFAITQPIENETLPIIQGELPDLVRVEVQVKDESGDIINPLAFIPSSSATPWVAVLADAQGRELDRQPVQLAENGKVFVSTLGSGAENPKRFSPGAYQLTIKLTENYRREVFRPLQEEASRRIVMRTVESFKWRIAEPISKIYPVYPRLGWFPEPIKLPLAIEVSDQEGQPLVAGDLVRPGAGPLFRAQIRTPDNRTYAVEFIPDEQPGRFVGNWPLEAKSKGQYVLEVSLLKENLSLVWMSDSSETQRIEFERAYAPLNMPWSLLALLLLLLLIGLTIVLIYLSTGPLAGAVLVFTKNGSPIGEVNVSGRLNRRRYRAMRKQLDEDVPALNLEAIQVTATKLTHDEEARLTANITLTWPGDDGDLGKTSQEVEDVNEGETVRISHDIRMKLEKRSAARVPLWVLALIIGAFFAWSFVFGYLYVTA